MLHKSEDILKAINKLRNPVILTKNGEYYLFDDYTQSNPVRLLKTSFNTLLNYKKAFSLEPSSTGRYKVIKNKVSS